MGWWLGYIVESRSQRKSDWHCLNAEGFYFARTVSGDHRLLEIGIRGNSCIRIIFIAFRGLPKHCASYRPLLSHNQASYDQEESIMSGVRLLVGTRKGAFVLTSDGKRRKWDISGPHFAGWEIYHLKGSPADPNRLYASQTSGWFGQVIQRSNDGGKTWEPGGNQFTYDGKPGTHLWYDGTPHPWEFKRVWHLEPSLTDPETVYAGVEDAALFRSTDGGTEWSELAG